MKRIFSCRVTVKSKCWTVAPKKRVASSTAGCEPANIRALSLLESDEEMIMRLAPSFHASGAHRPIKDGPC